MSWYLELLEFLECSPRIARGPTISTLAFVGASRGRRSGRSDMLTSKLVYLVALNFLLLQITKPQSNLLECRPGLLWQEAAGDIFELCQQLGAAH